MEKYKIYLENVGLTEEQKEYIFKIMCEIHEIGKIKGLDEAIKVVVGKK